MLDFDTLHARGIFDQRLPRYTSYPPAPAFHTGVGSAFQTQAIRDLPLDAPISLYLHIPFCERLCWFCACRTQGVRSLAPVEAYMDTLEAELALIADLLGGPVPLSQVHWGGGTPTILPPALITRLGAAIDSVFTRTPDTEFSVEIDPTLVDADKISALCDLGLTRASIGVQDFAPRVQECIGRQQSFEQTRDAVAQLRAAGVQSLNIDLVYGLPYQSVPGFGRTLKKVLDLAPDRIALFGYAHVPHMAKRQMLIPEAALPDDRARFALFAHATEVFSNAGLNPIGIDHFATAQDSMSRAARAGKLRRNFQGYTTDHAETLLGIGASAISRFTSGFVQNAPRTGDHTRAIRQGTLSGNRGYALTQEDRLRSRIIEMLMCDFAIDTDALDLSPAMQNRLAASFDDMFRQGAGYISVEKGIIRVSQKARPLVRLLANAFDAYAATGTTYSRVS